MCKLIIAIYEYETPLSKCKIFVWKFTIDAPCFPQVTSFRYILQHVSKAFIKIMDDI